jgi:hypothetical protein
MDVLLPGNAMLRSSEEWHETDGNDLLKDVFIRIP